MSFETIAARFPGLDRQALAQVYDAAIQDAYAVVRAYGDQLGPQRTREAVTLDDVADHLLRLRVSGDQPAPTAP